MQERVSLAERLGRVEVGGLHDRVAVEVRRRLGGTVTPDGRAGTERRTGIDDARAVLLHPGAPLRHHLGGLLLGHLVRRRRVPAVQQDESGHRPLPLV